MLKAFISCKKTIDRFGTHRFSLFPCFMYRQDVDAVDNEMQWQRAIEEEVQEAK